ncbi:hypothetical protein DPEC_G00238720 [Dallia pectoralis]|uniref:Uncharacterized protein n=1 Tax=Dallia pectoralis TaxID=75939 RepID=A0ACC2FZ37_DALPE|nr:hypothetical protein DPEC_G00238720 [Dallia pectoralis]
MPARRRSALRSRPSPGQPPLDSLEELGASTVQGASTIQGASSIQGASTIQGASPIESSPSTQREQASQCDQPTQREQGTQSVRRKRKTSFRDLDSEDFQAAKKICVSLAPSSQYSWKLPLTKLWGICRKIFGSLKQKVFGKLEDPTSFSSQYNVGRLLGTGGFGSVHAGTRKRDGKNVILIIPSL